MSGNIQHHPDPARNIALPGTAWRATVAVGEDGTESLWLVSPDPTAKQGCNCDECAPHEQDTTTGTTGTREREQTT